MYRCPACPRCPGPVWPWARGDDLFVNVLGFAKTQAPLHAASAQYYALVNREDLASDTAPPGYATLVLEWRLDGQADFLAPYALNSDGNPQFLKFYIPASNHRYSAKGLMDAMNSSMRGEKSTDILLCADNSVVAFLSVGYLCRDR